jgi:hypothetical protein
MRRRTIGGMAGEDGVISKPRGIREIWLPSSVMFQLELFAVVHSD